QDSKWAGYPICIPPYLEQEVDTVGFTYYEMQHNYTCGRNIVLDDNGTAHICWMMSSNSSWNPRHVYYNYVDSDGNQLAGAERTGLQVDGATRSGYTNITLTALPSGLDTTVRVDVPFVAFHATYSDLPDYHTDIGWDAMYRIMDSPGGFVRSEDGTADLLESIPPIATTCSDELVPYYPDLCDCDSVDLTAIWPRIAGNDDGNIYLASTPSNEDTLCGTPMPDYVVFWTGEPEWNTDMTPPLIHQYDWTDPLLLDVQDGITCDIDVYRPTGEIAVAYYAVYDTNDCERESPEGGVYYGWLQAMSLVYRKSNDGGITWSERQKILGPQDESGVWSLDEFDTLLVPFIYTDTLDTTIHFSKLDTYVVFYRPLWGTDVSLAYDPDGNLHAVFTAKMFTVTNVEYDCSTSVYYGSTIMHWDEASGEVKNICPPRFVSSTLVPGGESSTADETVIRPSIGFDNEGTAYVIWEQAWPGYYAYRDSLWGFIATHPETLSDADMEELDSLWYYTTGGTLDANADGVANNEIFIARSFDGGATWTPPQNISNTHAKLTSAGDDMSELDISIARKVDDKVHIFAVLDKSAGKSPRDVGEKVNCPVLHIAVDTTILNCDTCFACPDKIAEKYNNRPNKIAIEAHPNPFNASTEISWNSPTGGHTTVEIVDVNGRVVRTLYDDFSSSGNHTVVWDGMDNVGKAVSTGTYFCRVKSGDMKAATKITLLK
ncbi:T9SS type A sorting domain-containing protein, partial [bacterium]|nr:T9SS type A sorting domain-containing protein [bacterium]